MSFNFRVYSGLNQRVYDFQKALIKDDKLKGLQKKLKEAIEEFDKIAVPLRKRLITPVEREIFRRRKRIAVESGLAVTKIKDMVSKGTDKPLFELTHRRGLRVYVEKSNPFETYTFCDRCNLYIKGPLPGKNYDDIGPLCGSRGVEFSCPVCSSYLGREAYIHS